MKKLCILASLAILVFQCTVPKGEIQENEFSVSSEFIEIEDALNFYVLGDWGRNGQFGQKELADMMNMAAMQVEPEFIISTGDNFYDNGVASIHDPYWLSSYENVYDGALLFCDWYVVLGNHDYRGNPQAQIDYTEISRRWNMPSRYFFKDIETDDGASVRLVFIDTSPLNDEYYSKAKYRNIQDQDTTAQLVWMDSVLSKDMDWKIAVGHHPLYSGGKRKDDKNDVRSHIEGMLTTHEVDVYFAGHEHDLQHIKSEKLPTDHIISGAGSEVRPTGKMEYTRYAESIQGFVSASVTKDSIFCQFMDFRGNVLYQTTIKD